MNSFNYGLAWSFVITLLAGCHTLDADEMVAEDKEAENTVAQGQPQSEPAPTTAAELRTHILALGVHTPDPGLVLEMDDPKVKLGQMLFFDKVVSGNQDIACSTCHHPSFGTSDGLPTAIGVGGNAMGPQRAFTDGFIVPRNSPDLFNRGVDLWRTMFWDGRVSAAAGYFDSPAGSRLPDGLDSVLAVQAMFPPTSRHEMRGEHGENELADVEDSSLVDIWAGIAERLMGIDEYVLMFEAAYPEVAADDIGFEHAANALAAFEVAAFTKLDSPFDNFLAGDDEALSETAKYGASLFFGSHGCVGCHSGPLFTDQESHAIAAPQLGPGKLDEEGRLDLGRMLETDDPADRFAFRTPPLRNVELTGPYMHAGAYVTLEDAIRHHVRPDAALREYSGSHLTGAHQNSVVSDEEVHSDMIAAIDPELSGCYQLSEDDVYALAEFLRSLTDPSAREMHNLVPAAVPSGLPVE